MGWRLPLGTDHHVPEAADLYQQLDKRASTQFVPCLWYTYLLSAAYETQHTELGTHYSVGGGSLQ